MEALKEIKSLRMLSIHQANVTKPAVADLQKALPELLIVR
jgi:hypothetical protein